MAIDVKAYIDKLAQESGLSQEEKDSLLKVTGNEKFSKGLAESVMLRSDYSREMDALAAEKQKLDASEKRNEQWYAKEVANFNATEQLRQKYEAALNFGDVQNNDTIHSVQDGVTKKELEEMLASRDRNVITVVKGAMRYATDHLHRFGEPLDPDALEKIAIDKQLSLEQAHKELIAPKVEAKTSADMAKQLKEAEEKGAREALSKHHLPVDSKPREQSPFFSRPDPATLPAAGPLREAKLREGFVEEFEKGMATSGGS